MPAQRIGEIVAGKRTITADTDLRLCRFFGLSDGWWLHVQADYDTKVAKAGLAKIRPWKPVPSAMNCVLRTLTRRRQLCRSRCQSVC